MAKFILFGPPASGKTTLMYSYKGQPAPDGATEDIETLKVGGFLGLFGRDKLQEYGGNIPNIPYAIEGIGEIDNNTKLLFVFRGDDLIRQLQEAGQGSRILALWSHFRHNVEINRCYFVATHADEVDDMKAKILNSIKTVNNEYQDLLGTNIRRIDINFFDDPYFHCINATDSDQAKNLFNTIKR